MTALVVDASVALKWFVPEAGSEDAARLLEGSFEFLAPDLLYAECGNIVWKKAARRELSVAEGRDILAALGRVPIAVAPSSTLIEAAFEIATAYRRTVYDALYVALAVARDCQVVTADERMGRALRGGPLARHLRSLSAVT